MNENNNKKEILEKQFNDLMNKAKQMYPDINETVSSYSNMTASSKRLQDYLNLSMQTPFETSNNHVVLI